MSISLKKIFKNVLIFGGSGFIGSNFVRFFYHQHPDCSIINFDLLTYAGNPSNLLDLENLEVGLDEKSKRYHFVQGDICDTQLLYSIFKEFKPDLIINFAAESHVDRSIINSYDFTRTNFEGVRSIIETVRKFSSARFIQISTDEVYGDTPSGCSIETSPFRPSNPYAASKASADLLVQSYIRTYSLPAIIIRGSNNFGPYQYPEKFMSLAITNFIENKKIPVHGTGDHVRSWLHVFDFCRAIDLIAWEANDFSIYNVSGEEKSNLEILEILANYFNKNLDNHKEHVGDRPGADFRYAPDSSKLKKELGWKIEYPIKDSINVLISWYVDNHSWWQKLKKSQEFEVHYLKQSKAQYF